MVGVLEGAGLAVVAGAAGQVLVGLYGSMQRRAAETKRAEAAARHFEQRARLRLESERAERDRRQLSWNGQRKLFIERKVLEADDVCSFYLKAHDHKPLAPFKPGQYLTFQLKIPDQPKPVIRCYSLSDSPLEKDHYRVTIKRLGPPPKAPPDTKPGLSSSFFHQGLKEGDILDVRAPGGHFFLDETSERPVVLIGGGVGLTPVLSMLNTICKSGSKRETWFFYGIRNRAEHAMYDHLAEIARDHDHVHIQVCYSQPTDSCVEGRDYQHKGFVAVELFRKLLPSNNYEFYICGPPPMMEMITNDLSEWGVPEEHVNFEAFGPATVKKKAPPAEAKDAAASADEADGIEIVFARSGKTLQWKSDSGSILDFAEDNGIPMDSACRAGNCGTCITAVKEGSVSYLSEPGADVDTGSCLACVAVPKGRLVIEA